MGHARRARKDRDAAGARAAGKLAVSTWRAAGLEGGEVDRLQAAVDGSTDRHVWTLQSVWRLDRPEDATGAEILDVDRLLILAGPVCWKCGEKYRTNLADAPCRVVAGGPLPGPLEATYTTPAAETQAADEPAPDGDDPFAGWQDAGYLREPSELARLRRTAILSQ